MLEIIDFHLLGGGAAEGAHTANLLPLANTGVAVLVFAAGHDHGLAQGLQADHAEHYLYLIYKQV